MPQPNLESFTRRALVVRAEVTEGVDPLGLPSTHAFQILDGKSGLEFDKVERKLDKPYFSNDPFSVANERTYIEGMFELTPPTVPGAPTTGVASAAPVLLPSGMAQTLTFGSRLTRYNPISTGIPSVFAYWWHAGTYREVPAARGNITGLAMQIGERFKATIRLQGNYSAVEEDTLPTDTDYTAFATPTVAQFDNTEMISNVYDANGDPVGDTDLHLRGKMLSVDFGNQLATKEYTEYKTTNITDRKATFTARFARPDITELDTHAAWEAGQIVEFTFRLIETDGRYSLLYVRGQIDQITDTDTDGDFTYEITGNCIATSTGGDEFYIEFGDDTFAINFDFIQPKVEDVVAVYIQPALSGIYTAPVTWTISSGTLPAGLSINAATGAITGTPTTVGVSAITIRAEDSDPGTNLVATVSGSLTITA